MKKQLHMKAGLFSLLLILLLSLAPLSAYAKSKPLAFSQKKITLLKHRSKKLTPKKDLRNIRYKSSNTRIATVYKDGTVRAKAPGNAVITASWGGYKARIPVTVLPDKIQDNDRAALRKTYYDKIEPNGKKRIVFAGSSFFDRWNGLEQEFPQYQIFNVAVGGTKAIQWQSYYKKLVIPYHPDAVVLITGNNDIGKTGLISGETCASRVEKLLSSMRADLGPDVPIFFVSILKTEARKACWPRVIKANSLIRKYCSSDPNLYYVNATPKLLNKKGQPILSYYVSDRLHPSAKGYKVLKKVIAPYLKKYVR